MLDEEPGADRPLEVLAHRSDPDAVGQFVVSCRPGMKVLDVLVAIQRDHDPSLAFRYSCRVAMCGTCGLRVDGTAALACQTTVPATVSRLHLAPLAGFPVVRDLVVDPAPFFERWAAITPYLVPDPDHSEPAVIRPDSVERQAIDGALDCITCGICYSACAVSAMSRDFLGPAALNRAMVLIADSRDTARPARLRRVAEVDGVDRCHYIGACTACCPKGIDPFAAIRLLRRWRLRGVPARRPPKRLLVRARRSGHGT
jgi:succinate dehydrogenase/fumarate reductase iron-sulfur protein